MRAEFGGFLLQHFKFQTFFHHLAVDGAENFVGVLFALQQNGVRLCLRFGNDFFRLVLGGGADFIRVLVGGFKRARNAVLGVFHDFVRQGLCGDERFAKGVLLVLIFFHFICQKADFFNQLAVFLEHLLIGSGHLGKKAVNIVGTVCTAAGCLKLFGFHCIGSKHNCNSTILKILFTH